MIRRRLLLLGAAAVLTACGSSSATSSPTFTATASSAVAVPASGETYLDTNTGATVPFAYATSFTVTVEDTSGTATTLSGIQVALQQASGGVVVSPAPGQAEIYRYQVHASSNAIPPKGSVSIRFDFVYSLPSAGKEAIATVVVGVLGSTNLLTTQTVKVNVN